MNDLIESAHSLIRLIDVRESLEHPKHAKTLNPLFRRLGRILRARFRRQRLKTLKSARPFLRDLAMKYSEADDDLKQRLQSAVTAHIEASASLSDNRDKDATFYDQFVRVAAQGGIESLATQRNIEAAEDAGNQFAQGYLRDRGFAKLASDVDATTKTRLANAVADVYAGGGSYADAVGAIKSTFIEANNYRADMIARTELAAAYNQAIYSSAQEIPDAMKEWSPALDGCEEICAPNADEGPIPMSNLFSSGDAAPPAHPNCMCSLSIVLPQSE